MGGGGTAEAGAVLVTRPLPLAAETASRVAALGFRPVLAPLLAIRTLPSALPAPAELQAVLATSFNAVAALPAAYRALKLLAVGDATAARARAAGHQTVHSAAGDAAALARLTANLCDPDGATLLLAVGEGQGTELAAALRARGFVVAHHAVYAADRATALPASGQAAIATGLHAALFFSAETALVFAALVESTGLGPALAPAQALTIAAPAAAALQHLPWRHMRIATRPTQDALLALL